MLPLILHQELSGCFKESVQFWGETEFCIHFAGLNFLLNINGKLNLLNLKSLRLLGFFFLGCLLDCLFSIALTLKFSRG